MFLSMIALISLVVVIWVVLPLIQTKKDVSPDLQSVNAKLLEDQLTELDRDLEQGVIAKELYESARLDLQKTFLETATVDEIQPSLHAKSDPLIILLVAIILPIGAYFIYKQVGTDPGSIQYMADLAAQSDGGASNPHSGAGGGADVSKMVESVRAKAEADPDDLESWSMLAKSLHIMKDIDGASKAYLHLINKGVQDAELYANYADVLASQAGGILVTSPAYEWTQKALEIDPNHDQALWIAGTAAYYSKDYALAKQFWQHLLSLLDPGTDAYLTIKQNLDQIAQEEQVQ